MKETKNKLLVSTERTTDVAKAEADRQIHEIKTDCKHSNGYWCKQEYDSNGNETYYENSDGYWRGIPQSQSCDGEVVEIEGHFVWT